jgi:hypothetical protein
VFPLLVVSVVAWLGKYSLLGDCCELAAVAVIAVSAPAVIITGAITVYSLGDGY